jgi:hypothetical protein
MAARDGSTASIAPGRIGSHVKNALLMLVSMVATLIVAEGVVRYIDGYDLLGLPLSFAEPMGVASVKQETLDRVPRARGVERDWFFADPAPLPNRRPVPEEWQRLFRFVETHPVGGLDFLPSDAFKAWNTVFAGDPCQNRRLRFAPGQLFFYDPQDRQAKPPYRFPPNATIPSGLTTNQIGWRGAPIEDPRGEKTIRIVFVGSSTVVESHHFPFSWPEFVGSWLNVWAKSKGLAIRFEVLNAARESIGSSDIAAIVRTEVLPLRPDLVVYHEGGNQFRPHSIVEKVPEGPVVRPSGHQTAGSASWLAEAARYSALMGRVQAALRVAEAGDGREWPKPDYRVVWPAGLDELDPDLSHPNLPVSLNAIQKDLDQIRTDLATVGGELAISSFVWMVKDGLVVEPLRHKYILEQLNAGNWPFRYRDLERLAVFQNRLLAKYAALHKLPFVDIASSMSPDPDLFTDAVHTNYAGTRIRAWAAFNQLLPTIEKNLATGAWPRTWPSGASTALPTFTPRQTKVDCKI